MISLGRALLSGLLAASAAGCTIADSGPSPEALEEYGRLHSGSHAAPSQAFPTTTDPAIAGGAQTPPPAPAVHLTVVSAEALLDFDSGLGETDAYVRLEWDGRRYQTSVAPDTTNPSWGDSFVLPVRAAGILHIEVYDEDVWSDERMAVVALPLPLPAVGESIEWAVPLKDGEGGTLRLRVLGVTSP